MSSREPDHYPGPERSRMRWSHAFREAMTSATQRPVRTVLTALGTLLGVGTLVTTTSVSETARAQVSSRFDALKATEVAVIDVAPDGTNPFPLSSGPSLAALNGVRSAGLMFQLPASVVVATSPSSDGSLAPGGVSVIAAESGALDAALAQISTGRPFNPFYDARSERVALLGRAAAADLDLARVDNQPAIFLDGVAYVVIGIVDSVGRRPELLSSVIIPASTAARDWPHADAAFEILIDTEPGAAQLVGRQVALALRPNDPGRLEAVVPPDPNLLRNQVSEDLTNVFLALSALAMAIGAAAIANASLVSVIERRSEIGLRRALGAERSHIRRQFCLEAGIVGGLGGVAGASLGVIVVVAVSALQGWQTVVDPLILGLAPVLGVAAGVISGLGPAVKASRTPPWESLRL